MMEEQLLAPLCDLAFALDQRVDEQLHSPTELLDFKLVISM
jgi:hypothetical protein